MQTDAIFENIAIRIEQEINKAQKSVFIAVAWFTNKNLFNALVNKSKEGCSIYLIISNDKINNNSGIDFDSLVSSNGQVYKVGNVDTVLMHNKFCIIDYSTVITGSYNWSYKAETNFENVIITIGDTVLAQQFVSEFNSIRLKFYPNELKSEASFPLSSIIKRLEILKNYVILEEIGEFRREIKKLEEYDFNEDLKEIIDHVKKREFASAIMKIEHFISCNQMLSVWIDTEINALKFEIKILENQLNAFDNEKIELEKMLSSFQHRHTIELGEIILEVLKLKKLKYKDDEAKYKEADDDEQDYQEQLNREKIKDIFNLTDDEKKEIKSAFRKATVLCHPDKVIDELKDTATKIFIELKAAYDVNDIKRVKEILDDLETGNYFKSRSEAISEKASLKAAIAKLHLQINILESEIIAIKQSDTFRIINGINNLDEYFNSTKEKLLMELEQLKLDIKDK